MMRKILQAGPSTLSISLPTTWVKKCSLKRGQELQVEEQGNSIKVSTNNVREEETASLDITSISPISTKILGMLYKAGYKKINAFYDPKKTVIHRGKEVKELDMVRNTFDHFIGMQFWELGKKDGKHYATVVESAKIDPAEFNNVLNKLCLNILHQAEQVTSSLSEKTDYFEEALLTERMINQSADFCTRILVTYGHEQYKKTVYYYDFVNKLENIGDKYFKIALEHHTNKKIDKNTLAYIMKTSGFLKEFIELYIRFDMKRINALTRELHKSISEYESDTTKKEMHGNIIAQATYALLLIFYDLIETLYYLNHDNFREK